MSVETWIFVSLSTGALLALAGGALVFLETVRMDPLQRPTRLAWTALAMIILAFVALTVGYVIIIKTSGG